MERIQKIQKKIQRRILKGMGILSLLPIGVGVCAALSVSMSLEAMASSESVHSSLFSSPEFGLDLDDFDDDSSELLKSVKTQLGHWEKNEEYVRIWNLGPTTPLVKLPTEDEKKRYFSRTALKYLDKRIREKMKKRATAQTRAQIQAVLSTGAKREISILKGFKLKLRARPLRSRASVSLVNPYVECLLHFSARRGVKMRLSKTIDPIRLKANLDYDILKDTWKTTFDKSLSKELMLRFSASHSPSSSLSGTPSDDASIHILFKRRF